MQIYKGRKTKQSYARPGAQRGEACGAQCPERRITGGYRVPAMLQVLSSMQYIYYQKTLHLNIGAKLASCFWLHLTSVRAWTHITSIIIHTATYSQFFCFYWFSIRWNENSQDILSCLFKSSFGQ